MRADFLSISNADLYRPFGAGSPTATDLMGRLVADLQTRGALQWTHYFETAATSDIRDGCTRAAGTNAIAYADGDELRIDGTRYAVVWVEVRNEGSNSERKRAYLMRN